MICPMSIFGSIPNALAPSDNPTMHKSPPANFAFPIAAAAIARRVRPITRAEVRPIPLCPWASAVAACEVAATSECEIED